MIVVSLGSLMLLTALWLLHFLLVRCKLLSPKVSLAAGVWSPEVMSCLLLNSAVLGVMCRWVVCVLDCSSVLVCSDAGGDVQVGHFCACL